MEPRKKKHPKSNETEDCRKVHQQSQAPPIKSHYPSLGRTPQRVAASRTTALTTRRLHQVLLQLAIRLLKHRHAHLLAREPDVEGPELHSSTLLLRRLLETSRRSQRLQARGKILDRLLRKVRIAERRQLRAVELPLLQP